MKRLRAFPDRSALFARPAYLRGRGLQRDLASKANAWARQRIGVYRPSGGIGAETGCAGPAPLETRGTGAVTGSATGAIGAASAGTLAGATGSVSAGAITAEGAAVADAGPAAGIAGAALAALTEAAALSTSEKKFP